MTTGVTSTAPADLTERPGPRAVVALRRRLVAWLAVELGGLAALAVAGWDGVPQPWLTLGLMARGLAVAAVAAGARDLHPASGRAPVALAALAILLLPGFSVALVPPLFTEAGWDAVLGLALTPTLALLAGAVGRNAAASARPVGQRRLAARLDATTLLAALAALTCLPTLAPDMSPTPWLAPAGWLATWALALAAGALTRGEAAAALLVAGLAGAAVFEHLDDPVTGRGFVATFGLLSVALVGHHLTAGLRALADALADAAVTPVAPRVTWRAATTEGAPLSEADADALVDEELGFSRPASGRVVPFLPEEAVAALPPLEPAAARVAPSDPPERHAARARSLRRLLIVWPSLALALVFGALLAVTPLGDLPAMSRAAPLLLAVAALTVAVATRAVSATFEGPARTPWHLATWLAVTDALALIGLAAAPEASRWLIPGAATLALFALGATVAGLSALSRHLGASPPRTLGRLPGLVLSLGLFAAASAAHARFAPGDMAWLGAPLSLALGLLLLATAHALAWALHDLRQDLHDAETRSLRAAGIARTAGASVASR